MCFTLVIDSIFRDSNKNEAEKFRIINNNTINNKDTKEF